MSNPRNYPCDICNKPNYTNNQRQLHKAKEHYCCICKNYVLLRAYHHCVPVQIGHGSSDPSPFVLTQAGLDTFEIYTAAIQRVFVSVDRLVSKYKKHITQLLEELLVAHKNIKARLVVKVHLIQQKTGEETQHDLGTLNSILLHKSQIKRFIFNQVSHIVRRLNFYSAGGSSWSVLSLPFIYIHVSKYRPLKVGDYIPTPECFKGRHGMINIKTKDNMCFPYSIIACYLRIKTQSEGEKIGQYKSFINNNFNEQSRVCSTIDFTCLPQGRAVRLEDIPLFERRNPNFSVNVYSHMLDYVYPIRITSEEKQHHADLLMLWEEETDNFHFVLIRDFNLFMKDKNNLKRFFCKRCFHSFNSQLTLSTHIESCKEFVAQRIIFPEEESVNYKLGGNEIQQAFYVSADFETYMKKVDDTTDNPMKILSRHEALSYGYAYVGGGSVAHWKYYDGVDPDRQFVIDLLELADYHRNQMSMYKKVMKMSWSNWFDFVKSRTCIICKLPLDDINVDVDKSSPGLDSIDEDDGFVVPKRMRFTKHKELMKSNARVRHHWHGGTNITPTNDLLFSPSRYRGVSHIRCNLQLKSRSQLTVVMHNFSNFDSKLILEGCAKLNITNINILAKSSEKILSLEIDNKLKFIDSNLHLNGSLFSLSNTLRKSGLEKFKITKKILHDRTEREYDLLLSKQAFPYEYCTPSTLDIQSNILPPKEVFYSSLKNSHISDEDYANAQQIYSRFNCKSLRDYLRLYNILDVGILADIIEEHRMQCKVMYNVDPLNFLTLPSVSFNVGMSESTQTLDYIRDIELYLEVKKATRGGVVNFSKRHVLANLPHMPEYDETKPIRYLVQLDINSLYPMAMTKALPTQEFVKLTETEVAEFDIHSVDEEGPHGYLLNVDVVVPDDPNLHNFLSDLPPLPEKIVIEEDLQSAFQKSSEEAFPNLKSMFGAEQYLCTLYDKKNYSAFVPTLKQAVDVGLRIEKINSIWKFEQLPFVKDFVDKNVSARTQAECPSRKQALKLIINAFYGRTTINTGNFRDFTIVTDHIKAQKLVRKPLFKSFSIVNEHMALIELKRASNYVNNHMIVGAAILDKAKAYFYRVWYQIKRTFGDKVSLIYVDTDSYLLSIETENLLESLKSIKLDGEEVMDFSYLPNTEEFKDFKSNKFQGVVGKLKSETNEKLILEAIVLKKKQYAFDLMTTKS